MDNIGSRFAPSPEAASDDFASPVNLSPVEARLYWRGFAAGLARAGAPVPPDIVERSTEPTAGTESAAPAAAPWDAEAPEEPAAQRHDAFTGARKQAYLKALAKAGCILDACRLTSISSSTVYNHQAADPEFARNCRLALDMASTPLELTAYERAVVGIEEEVIRGGKVVGTRMRRSDYMLRIMLQGANPKKYGARPGFTRKRLLKFERDRIEREVRARIRDEANGGRGRDAKTMLDDLATRLAEIEDGQSEARRAAGWTDLGCGVSVPPGWQWVGEGDPTEAVAQEAKKSDAVCNSSNSSTSPPNLSPAPLSP
jgi:hypothetical protein